jgi:hypothetical protein
MPPSLTSAALEQTQKELRWRGLPRPERGKLLKDDPGARLLRALEKGSILIL